jgi:hypothetical protein
MKKLTSISFLVLVIAATLTGCTQKASGTKTVYTTITNPSTTNPTTPTGSDSNSCGLVRDGATRCYFSELPTLIFSGSGEAGYNYWSSATDLPPNFSISNFRTDTNFTVRIKPVIVNGGKSIQGRKCSQFTKTTFSRLQVKLMLSKTSDNGLSTNIKTLTANVDSFSSKVKFTVPGGTNDPYVLSVYSVLSDHRCKWSSPPAGCPSAYYDIPLVTSTANPTECVGFELQFATDDTYDLP